MIAEVMKEIARGCIGEEVQARLLFGTVVKVEERLALSEELLVIPKELKKRVVPVEGSEGTVIVSPGLKAGDRVILMRLGDAWLVAGTVE